ncbi:acyltransferase domain containing protein, putative [Eimeria tenella]|uniref:Acyltransferase domain containing protein, putative n=1 Tax=Eimeria tenella TaxID=5802 RepID=U6L1J3_EIMTE|nr:acyltransferase domain containing protein, putative [Eimeria tenella]CDJ43063.1 acyltransferase domain containing protein, putative [Eimeria tenella]|eukprot:XP_013233813.1 acyltransferase domain containing protein, putative [Eimeria tenella]
MCLAWHRALEDLVERMKMNPSDPACNPIVVFPEGTTTNGRCLIQFRRGAFTALQRVQPCVLIYTWGCIHPAYELIPTPYFISLSLSAWPASELRAYWLPPIDPPAPEGFDSEEKRIAAFATQVRNAMWKVLKKEHFDAAEFSDESCPDTWDGNQTTRKQFTQLLLRGPTEAELQHEKKRS